jgi:hypothetical protein
VERRQASASRWTRAASQDAEVGHPRLSAFRLPFFFRHCERSEAIQGDGPSSWTTKLVRTAPLDCFVASLLAMTSKTRARIASRERIHLTSPRVRERVVRGPLRAILSAANLRARPRPLIPTFSPRAGRRSAQGVAGTSRLSAPAIAGRDNVVGFASLYPPYIERDWD